MLASGDPLDKVRQGLGLDRLAVRDRFNGNPALEAGRYIAPGVYLGARRAVPPAAVEASVQVDIAKGLKDLKQPQGPAEAQASVSPRASNGTSVGVPAAGFGTDPGFAL